MSSGRSAGLEWFLLLMAPPSQRPQMSAKFSGLKVDKAIAATQVRSGLNAWLAEA